jgi:hypothetical protein
MEKFKYGIMVIDPLNPDDLGTENVTVIHFVGYWEKLDWDIEAERLREELRTDPDFTDYFKDIADRLKFYPATEDCLKYYNDMDEINKFLDEPNQN